MSNKKKAKKNVSSPLDEVILTESNIQEVSDLLGYATETLIEILDKAKDQGYSGVRLSALHR